MLHPNGNIKWEMLSSTHYKGEKGGYEIEIFSGNPNRWFISKDGVVIDCAYYHRPTKESAKAKVDSEMYLNEIIKKAAPKELNGMRISGVDEQGGYYQFPESDTPNAKYRIADIPIQSGTCGFSGYKK